MSKSIVPPVPKHVGLSSALATFHVHYWHMISGTQRIAQERSFCERDQDRIGQAGQDKTGFIFFLHSPPGGSPHFFISLRAAVFSLLFFSPFFIPPHSTLFPPIPLPTLHSFFIRRPSSG